MLSKNQKQNLVEQAIEQHVTTTIYTDVSTTLPNNISPPLNVLVEFNCNHNSPAQYRKTKVNWRGISSMFVVNGIAIVSLPTGLSVIAAIATSIGLTTQVDKTDKKLSYTESIILYTLSTNHYSRMFISHSKLLKLTNENCTKLN